MGEVMYRTVIVLCETHHDGFKAVALAKERDIYQGSCTGIGLSTITLLCTPGEAGTYGRDLRELGVCNKVIFDGDAPHRPENWPEPEYRPNWERVGQVASV